MLLCSEVDSVAEHLDGFRDALKLVHDRPELRILTFVHFDTLYIQIVGRLVQDKEVGRVVTNHQAAESESHFFASTELDARLIPARCREEKSIQPDFYFVLRQGTYIE